MGAVLCDSAFGVPKRKLELLELLSRPVRLRAQRPFRTPAWTSCCWLWGHEPPLGPRTGSEPPEILPGSSPRQGRRHRRGRQCPHLFTAGPCTAQLQQPRYSVLAGILKEPSS